MICCVRFSILSCNSQWSPLKTSCERKCAVRAIFVVKPPRKAYSLISSAFIAFIMGMEVRKECMLKDVIFPMVWEYGIRIKYAHPMIQFILTMMTLFFIFQRKYVKFQFIAHVNPAKSSRTAALFSYSRIMR